MLSIRAVARSTARSFSRFAAPYARQPIAPLRHLSPLQSKWSRTALVAAFSTSQARYDKEGSVDQELVAKFESELELEQEVNGSHELPPTLKGFLEEGSFKLNDIPGQEEVELVRKFGDETIRIKFSIADIDGLDPESGMQDRAFEDEDDESLDAAESGKDVNNNGPPYGGNNKVDEEESFSKAEEAQEDAEDDESQEPSFPARVNVTIEKPGKGALHIVTVAQDGVIVIDNVYYFKDASSADPKTAEKDFQRRGMYTGPPFGNLDEDLQVLLERYLDERGVNTALALFVPDYIDFKEQKEYVNWLSNAKSFVEA
ncbi:MAG: hypothetical protein M1829_005163 [Trizodia sp. TS-e1964]|nr:MAG: hypothetical protein M1829_005163 [Trizodia sp. TS-e1964]